jgi:hypothetical protein
MNALTGVEPASAEFIGCDFTAAPQFYECPTPPSATDRWGIHGRLFENPVNSSLVIFPISLPRCIPYFFRY